MGNQLYQDSSTIILILSIAMIFNYSIILFPGLIIEGKTKLLAKINFITGLFNLVLNYFVMYFFESIFYIAFATLLSQIIYFSLNAYNSSKFYTFHRYKFLKFLKSLLFFSLIIFFSILLPSLDFNYLLKIIIFILLVIFMVGLIDKSVLKKFIKTISFK